MYRRRFGGGVVKGGLYTSSAERRFSRYFHLSGGAKLTIKVKEGEVKECRICANFSLNE
jgi:hypothetical protein